MIKTYKQYYLYFQNKLNNKLKLLEVMSTMMGERYHDQKYILKKNKMSPSCGKYLNLIFFTLFVFITAKITPTINSQLLENKL